MFKKLVVGIILIAIVLLLWRWSQTSIADGSSSPAEVSSTARNASDIATPGDAPESNSSHPDRPTIEDVLTMARNSLAEMEANLDDYTARFVKQERDTADVLGEPTEILVRIRTRFRGDVVDSPRRVYLRFNKPESLAGREVIWGEDIYDGQMAVHEVGMILGLKTIWLDRKGAIAMRGQRYPIDEIGLVKLVEKLIERGEQDRDNPDVRVEIKEDHPFDELATHRIRVRHGAPSGKPNDFSLAEIIFDPARQLVLSYRSFGWPVAGEADSPLLESYAYHDLKTNVGLTDKDFDTKNPNYRFPSF